jgi:membrane protein
MTPQRQRSGPHNTTTRDGRADAERRAAALAARGRAWAMGWWPLLKQTLADWWEDRAPRLGAALAFYTVLSLAPLLVIVTPMLGAVFGDEQARQGIAKQFGQLVGPEGAAAIDVMLRDPEVIAAVAGEAATQPATQPATRPTSRPASAGATRPAAPTTTTQPTTQPAAAAALSSPGAGPPPQRTAPPPRRSPWPGRFAWLLSIMVLAFGATNVFAELQDSLNTIWEVTPKPGRAAVWDFVRQRLLSFAMVMAIGFLLLVSLVLSTLLEALQAYFTNTPVGSAAQVWQLSNTLVSFLAVTALFALMFKVLPDVRLRWRDVLVGAVLTAALFTVGRHLIGQYLGRVGVGERYGASRSMVALLVWVYYSAQILLLGAEFTKVWSRRTRGRVEPTENAVPITEEARAQQGIAHQEVVQAVTEVVERKEADGTAEPSKCINLGDGEDIRTADAPGAEDHGPGKDASRP